MFPLIRFFIELCLLRARPQDLPSSEMLLALVAAANILLSTLGAIPTFGSVGAGFGASALDTAFLAAFIWALLRFHNRPERFVQTTTAALGIGVVVSVVSLPLQMMLPDDPAAAESAQVPLALLQVLTLWILVAIGHVLRHALDVRLPLGIGLALLYAVTSGALILTFFLPPIS